MANIAGIRKTTFVMLQYQLRRGHMSQGGAVCMRRLINVQVGHIISLMQSGIDVAIVTAAGYPGQPEMFEKRVAGLLAAFRRLRLPSEITDRHVLSYSICVPASEASSA